LGMFSAYLLRGHKETKMKYGHSTTNFSEKRTSAICQ
jgi:hypothetical protein